MAGNVTVKAANLLQRRRRIHIAHDHQDHVRGRVPLVGELLQHRPCGLVERRPRPQRIVRVRRAREHVLVQPGQKFVGRIRKVARDFLLDRAPLLIPLRVRIVDPTQARRLRLQRHVDVRRRHRLEILRDVLLRVRIVVAAHERKNCRRLIRRHPLAPAERHVLLRVRHARKSIRRLVATHEEVRFHRHHRRQRIADDHHPHPVGESGAGDGSLSISGPNERRGGKSQQDKRQKTRKRQTLHDPSGRTSLQEW